jgi:hydrogenase/urease accessory protein HupE
MLASLGSGQVIARTGRYKVLPVTGSVLMVIGMGLLVTIGSGTALWTTDIYMAIFGIGLGLNNTSFLNGLAKPLSHPFFVGFSAAGDVVFAITAILLLAAVVLSVCLKEVPLRLVSGNQARAEGSDPGAAAEGETAAESAGTVR